MKTIVIDARESGTSTGRYIDKLIEYLATLKPAYNITVLTKPHRMRYILQIAPNFTVLESTYKEFTFDEQIGLLKQIRSLKADLVHFGMVQQPVLYTGKTVTTMHDLTTTRFKNPSKNQVVITMKQIVYKWVNKRVARKSEVIITPTKFVKDDVVCFARIDPAKVAVTYEAADRITDKPEVLPALKNKQFIMYVGRPMPHKNLERLVEAFASLQAGQPHLYLALVGKTDLNYQRLATFVKNKHIQNVLITDFVSEGQLRWMYEHCAAYVFPSLSEGFGLPGLEAMIHGAPVVSSNASCLPEVYGQSVHYFNPLDVPAMAEAINTVLTDNDLREKLIKLGYEQVKKYSWEKMAEETLAIYEQLLDPRN